ncbi:MAG: hypothetical protein ACREME_06315 [Gemmatimonadales bacterium]
MMASGSRPLRLGLVLWLTALLLAALDVRPLNTPEAGSRAAPAPASPTP